MALVDVLIPNCGRKTGLAIVLTSLLGQTFTDFDVFVADQTPEDDVYLDSIEIRTLAQALEWHGHHVKLLRNLPRRGIAQQRQFLLEQSSAPYVHYFDDDVLIDPRVMERMLSVLQQEDCGFVGAAATGLGFLNDVRPHQQHIELWEGPVRPETFDFKTFPWERYLIHNAANPLHLEQKLVKNGQPVRYKIGWAGANVLYDRARLLSVGGFSWWNRLPPNHSGEDVLAQMLLLRKYGGCGILPSGTYHLCLPTTLADREFKADHLFDEIAREYHVIPVTNTK